MTRKRSLRGIRLHRNYTVDEAAKITGYAEGTLRRKIKAGTLPAIVDRRPHLILGGDLLTLVRPNGGVRTKLQIDECFCLKCRTARRPAFGVAEYTPRTASTGDLTALCDDCSTVMHKAISSAQLALLQTKIEVTVPQAGKHLKDTPDAR